MTKQTKKRIGVLVSGGGTNLQALLDAEARGELKSGTIAVVVASKPGAYALERAAKAGVEGVCVERKAYETREAFEAALQKVLEERQIDVLVLAGFMLVLSDQFIKLYPDRIINVHPALIPSFCGDGFYGLRVHERALEYGVKVTGATVHFVNEITDGGAIIMQKAVAIPEGISPEDLQQLVMKEAEHVMLPQAAELLCAGRLSRKGRLVTIDNK
ncbi:MAG: phosphoribosylglycinamide formyltransferase [Ruminococcaceae bacterium]|nr:phosphoribosylglycinamide formyltransferase [Oscillospiraceae bacterium]